MEKQRPVRCSDNEEVALYLWTKRQDMAAANGYVFSENLDATLLKAYANICNSKTPIKSLKDLSQIKGVGKWILRLMQKFFPKEDTQVSPSKNAAKLGTKAKGPKRYVPQKNSVAYALLITLYREIVNGVSFMKKKELIDAAEASGLSRASIGPDKSKVKPGQFVGSARDWYTGWSCMKTLISKGLVVKSSCPSKYMLTQEGQEAARECLLRSGLVDPTTSGAQNQFNGQNVSHVDFSRVVSTDNEAASQSADSSCQMQTNKIDTNIQCSQVHSSDSQWEELLEKDCSARLTACTSIRKDIRENLDSGGALHSKLSVSYGSVPSSSSLRACSSFDLHVHKSSDIDAMEGDANALALPPYRFGDKFEETYDVILILDDRENFGSRLKKIVDSIRSQFKILVEVRRLPVGDGIWIVRHKQSNKEYVLDFIVERKNVEDLHSSIRDNRYRDQKLRLQRCGLQKLIYLVEGDPNKLESAESIKTACFTTEILEGFDVHRTTGFTDTSRKYGHLTQSIIQYCCTHFSGDKAKNSRVCPSFDEFVNKCQDLEKMTVSDVFALQLMQVPQVTEEIAMAVIKLYPTLALLANAYCLLEGNVGAQEELLKSQSKIISGAASKNIFKLIWG